MWTEAEIDILRQCHATGCSAGIISSRLAAAGFVKTRNAVIGKLHRMGLNCKGEFVLPRAGGSTGVKPSSSVGSIIAPTRNLAQVRGGVMQSQARKGEAVENAEIRKLKILAQRMEAAELLDKPEAAPVKRLQLIDLEPHHCRFPCGSPGEDDFGFCGIDKIAGSSYCQAHAERCLIGAPKINLDTSLKPFRIRRKAA